MPIIKQRKTSTGWRIQCDDKTVDWASSKEEAALKVKWHRVMYHGNDIPANAEFLKGETSRQSHARSHDIFSIRRKRKL